MIKHMGIHIRLLLAAVILMSSSTVAFFAGINMLSTFIQTRFEERIDFLAQYLALNAELGILIDDRLILTNLAENLLTQRDVIKVVISDRLGQLLVDVSAKTSTDIANDSETFKATAPVIIKPVKEESQAFYLAPDNTSPEHTIGTVDVYYTTGGVNTILGEIRNKFYLLSAGFVTLSLFLFILLSHFLVKPVRELATTARKIAMGDKKLRATYGNLPETRELAVAFNSMLDSLDESNTALKKASRKMVRQKTLVSLGKFSLMVAHEVKNPLGIIKSSLDILKQDYNLSSDNTMVSYIEDEIQRMNKLIEEFLEFARPAAPTFRQTDMNMLLEECVTRFELQADNYPADFELNLPDSGELLHADPDLLTRVFNNIIKNAIEISDTKGQICITASTVDNKWICHIKDKGPGIPPEHVRKIFRPFYTTRSHGSGLGLAFVSQVISAHKGTITAENRKNGGACFTITLPMPDVDTPEQTDKEKNSPITTLSLMCV